jgi:hypothetical protein
MIWNLVPPTSGIERLFTAVLSIIDFAIVLHLVTL